MSLKLIPKITAKHIRGLKFATKMKVKLATAVLSSSVAAGLNYLVTAGNFPSSATATSSYCKRMNDIFDCLNSKSSMDKVSLRRPLTQTSHKTLEFLNDSVKWLERLQLLNKDRKCKWINGTIQSIHAVMMLNKEMTALGYKFLCTRNLNQDPLENFFGKIRNLSKFPRPYDFSINYGKLTAASLVRTPITSNCEEAEEEIDAFRIMNYVSLHPFT